MIQTAERTRPGKVWLPTSTRGAKPLRIPDPSLSSREEPPCLQSRHALLEGVTSSWGSLPRAFETYKHLESFVPDSVSGPRRKQLDFTRTGSRKPTIAFVNMTSLLCLFVSASIAFAKYGSGETLAIFGVESKDSNQGNTMSLLESRLSELAEDLALLKADAERLWQESEILRRENESLETRLEEELRERDETAEIRWNKDEKRIQYLEAIAQQIAPRTCQDLAEMGVNRTGTYLVDPDGALEGDPPIKVLCHMGTDPVTTVVLHDSMKADTEIDRCVDPGCYRRKIAYQASMKQMVALIDRSKSCDQRVKYDCFSAALRTGNIQHSWWVDRHGQPQHYWDGSNPARHVCKCGLTDSCIDSSLPCNCDAGMPRWESDSGAVADETALPVTELRFGGFEFEGQRANFTLGGLACRGEATGKDLPRNSASQRENPAESCASLRRAGNNHSGYHLIERKEGRLDIVSCRMDLKETDPEFQVETGASIGENVFVSRRLNRDETDELRVACGTPGLSVRLRLEKGGDVDVCLADAFRFLRHFFCIPRRIKSGAMLRVLSSGFYIEVRDLEVTKAFLALLDSPSHTIAQCRESPVTQRPNNLGDTHEPSRHTLGKPAAIDDVTPRPPRPLGPPRPPPPPPASPASPASPRRNVDRPRQHPIPRKGGTPRASVREVLRGSRLRASATETRLRKEAETAIEDECHFARPRSHRIAGIRFRTGKCNPGDIGEFVRVMTLNNGSGNFPMYGFRLADANSEEKMSNLDATTREHADQIAQLKASNENLRHDNKKLKHDHEALKHDHEALKRDLEALKSQLQEFLPEKGEKTKRNGVEARLQYLESIVMLQIMRTCASSAHQVPTHVVLQYALSQGGKTPHSPPPLPSHSPSLPHSLLLLLLLPKKAPRSCQALADLGMTKTGTYFVDPDGALVGDPPIQVFCDMKTDPVSTIVLHDSMKENTEIDRCDDPGCYVRNITYEASLKQMVSLIDQSQTCDQYIRYGCLSAALSTGGATQYAWWVDRHGQPQYYWHGWNSAVHVCKCGRIDDCIDNNLLCNCDAEAPQWESDSGTITNETALPITQLRFGGLQFKGQRANFTLGGLVCKGKASRDKIAGGKTSETEFPEVSCASLRRGGNRETGYHLIREKEGRLDVVLCRMELDEADPDFQVHTGARIAERGVYFDAYRNASTRSTDVITYEGTLVNLGDGMMPKIGIFTAPFPGIYAFHFHLSAQSNYEILVNLRRNEETQASLYSRSHANPGQSILLHLDEGDEVDAFLEKGQFTADANHVAHFVGYLLYPM
ncbi:unnamed protein product [Darwinula stevensoni]|uniref:C1q domain-containing protein n=1 Tax=Darwinula stevensoni TaxID=69355 RepID=A0A7R9A5X1_9CRUS|nr:unnamed protein product [Darwinula stevensoni]CAG0886204.1 unnamed protein product [Darwinula stevensoni]